MLQFAVLRLLVGTLQHFYRQLILIITLHLTASEQQRKADPMRYLNSFDSHMSDHARTDQVKNTIKKGSSTYLDSCHLSKGLIFHKCQRGNYILIMLLRNMQNIKGLRYIKDFITDLEKEQILAVINSNRWCDRLRRRQQYYGIKYFQTKINDQVLQPKHSTDHYPLQQLQFLVDKSVNSSIFQPQNPPNQVLVNRYLRHDKLGLHVQDTQAFGQIIMGVSLGSTEYLRLVNVDNPELAFMLQLEDKSCYVLTEQARYNYRHGIGRVKDNQKYKTDGFERISLTVRHVIETRRKIEGEQSY